MFLSLITSKLGLAGIALALVLGMFEIQALRLHGAQAEITSMKAAQKAAEADVQAHEASASVISTTASQTTAAERVRVQTVTRTLVQKVHDYVPPAADSRCIVYSGFVQLHDNAAAGVPGPASGYVEAPSGVPLSVVLDTVLENYGTAYDWRAEALGWRDWYAREAAAWAKK